MPSIDRPLSGDVLVFNLEAEQQQCSNPTLLERSGRNARTLVKMGSLRVTMVVLDAGGSIAEHRAEGAITVQPIKGRLDLLIGERAYDIGPGELVSAGPGVPHSVSSVNGASFLLTVSQSTQPA
jgi:quercetin dioxygenase-like cupin family protein